MKKNLIALAAFGAFSCAALAQSNVTVFGVIDLGFQYNDPKGGGKSSTRGINSGGQSGSRWGIRGVEALSPGLNVVFLLDGGYNSDDGTLSAPGSRLFSRQVWAGLSGRWGTVAAGRVGIFSSGLGAFDMFGNTDPFLTGFNDASLGSTFTSAGSLRVDNSVLYSSPTLGGFKFGAGYSFNGNGQEAAGSGNNNRVTFLGASFARGPFFAVITYDIIDVNDAGIAGSATTPAILRNAADQKHLQIGATFDLKFVKLHGAYAKEDRVYFTAGLGIQPDAGADADAWMAGVTVPLFGGTFLASYQSRDGDPVGVCVGGLVAATGACAVPLTTRERDVREWAFAYTYPLSRRTNLYAKFSDRDGEKFVNNDSTIDRKQSTVGIRHLF